MKRTAIALSIISILGTGIFTITSNASDQGITQPTINESISNTDTTQPNNGFCNGRNVLTEDQKNLIEKGYNELTQGEKDTLGKYRSLGKGNLTESQLTELYTIEDKVHKYMDDDFKNMMKERRENRELRKEQRGNGNCQNGKGNGQGRGACQN